MKRCVLVIPDAGPLNSLWVADRLDLLLRLSMPIVVVDAVYDEVTSDLRYPKDAAVKAFIDGHSPPFVIEQTDVGAYERERRRAGEPPKRNIGELAMMDFISDAGGVRRYLESSDPLLVLFEDRGAAGFSQASEHASAVHGRAFAGDGKGRRDSLRGRCHSGDDEPDQIRSATTGSPGVR